VKFLGKLFGSDKVIDAGIKGIDAAFYTEEEKAASLERRMQLKVSLLRAFEPFKTAQRFLALLYGIPYVTAWFSMFAASFFVDTKNQIELLVNSEMAYANFIILGFYFAGGVGESIFKYRAASKK